MNTPHQLIDHFERRLNYLRLSVTDRCNLNCIYCEPRRCLPRVSHSDILTYEEILRVAHIAVDLGISKIRVTGGEPLVRKGVCELLSRLTSIKGIEEVSLTTNAINLSEKLDKIKDAGIRRLNISLDSMKRERFKELTGVDGLHTVLHAIEKADRMGFHPLKINMVVMEGLNEDEVTDFARLSFEHPYHIRYIEYMPIGRAGSDQTLQHVSNARLRERLRELGDLVSIEKGTMDGPAERFKFRGAPGEIGFISPLSHHFCSQCNRLRLTAQGRLRPCLLSDHEEDLKGPMRAGAPDHLLAQIFLRAVSNKPHEHADLCKDEKPLTGRMSSIGG